MSTEEARTLIQAYFDQISDVAYIKSVFERSGVRAVAATLEEMIRTGEPSMARDAALFLEDALLRNAAPEDFRQSYSRSSLLAAVHEQLYARSYTARHLAVHLLGRRGPRSSGRVLLNALPWYLAHDPLNLLGLLDELLWLDRRMRTVAMRKRLVERLLRAPLFVTRWAAVEFLWEREVENGGWRWRRRREDAWVRQFLRRLAQDEHAWVRAEARWRLAQLRARDINGGRPRLRRPRGEERRPAPDVPSFFEVSLNVGNYLGVSGEADYDAALVEAITHHLVDNPITPAYDHYAYWSAFAASRSIPREASRRDPQIEASQAEQAGQLSDCG